jgi:hypothetical protein
MLIQDDANFGYFLMKKIIILLILFALSNFITGIISGIIQGCGSD